MKKFGAQIVVHEDSGFLMEAVQRVYPLMDKIVFLVGASPWNGEGDSAHVAATMNKITALADPDKKFIIVSKHWASEADTRNEGLDILRAEGCEWCLTLDDDEMYNRADLLKAKETISDWVCTNGEVALWLVSHLIYWKNRATAIASVTGGMPVFVHTDPAVARFNEARNVQMGEGTVWMQFDPAQLVLHHFSYVRSDAQMLRKVRSFSHAHQIVPDWYEQVWLAWTPEMSYLHPTFPPSFSNAVPATFLPWKLEPMPLDLEGVSVQQDPAMP